MKNKKNKHQHIIKNDNKNRTIISYINNQINISHSNKILISYHVIMIRYKNRENTIMKLEISGSKMRKNNDEKIYIFDREIMTNYYVKLAY